MAQALIIREAEEAGEMWSHPVGDERPISVGVGVGCAGGRHSQPPLFVLH